MDELRAISTFVKAAELGTFNRVAEVQNTTPQAVSKTIRQLEQHLGLRLFHRTTRKSTLTDEGLRFLEAVKPNLEGLVQALEQARGAILDEVGLVRVTAGGAVGRKVLVPLLSDFQQQYPRIQLDLLLEDRFSDLVSERLDVGFRAGNPLDAQVVGRHLFAVQQVVCASPAYLAQHGTPRSLQDLLTHRCTGYRQPGTGRSMPWEFEIGGQTPFLALHNVLCSNDPEAEMHAVLAGMGIGQIDSINAAAPLREGRLVPLLVDTVSNRMGLYLYYPQRTDMPGRVRRFIDFAVAQLQGSTQFSLSAKELSSLAR